MTELSQHPLPAVPAPESVRRAAQAGLAALQGVVVGKDAQVRRAFAAMLAGGHVLLEDLPGVGKTTLAKGLSRILGGTFQRVQGTNDLLPSDLLGVHLWDAQAQTFRFQPGPIFCHVLLLDELNRIGPKTQSAMMEAMVEGQVTLDRSTHALPEPFFVVATQNPLDHAGTFPLPESQLDCFSCTVHLGYPDRAAELLRGFHRFLNGEGRNAAWHRHTELAQDFLALVFVNLHEDALRSEWFFSPASKLDCPGQALDNTACDCIMLQRTKLLPALQWSRRGQTQIKHAQNIY